MGGNRRTDTASKGGAAAMRLVSSSANVRVPNTTADARRQGLPAVARRGPMPPSKAQRSALSGKSPCGDRRDASRKEQRAKDSCLGPMAAARADRQSARCGESRNLRFTVKSRHVSRQGRRPGRSLVKRPGRRQNVRNEPFGDDEIGDHDMPSFARETWRAGRGRVRGGPQSLRPLIPLRP